MSDDTRSGIEAAGWMTGHDVPKPGRSWIRARMGAVVVGLIIAAMGAAAIALEVPKFVLYLVGVPFVLVVGVGYVGLLNRRAMLEPHPVPPKSHRIRTNIALEHAGQIVDGGFFLESSFRLPSIPMSLVFLWRNPIEHSMFAIYQLGITTTSFDIVTEFTDGAELTTSTSVESTSETPARFFKQARKEAEPEELLALHREGVRFLEEHGLERKVLDLRPIREVWLESVSQSFDRMMSRPHWALRMLWRSAMGAGGDYRLPLAQQYPEGIPGPRQGEVLRGPSVGAAAVHEARVRAIGGAVPGPMESAKRAGKRTRWSAIRWQLLFVALTGLLNLGVWVAEEVQERDALRLLESDDVGAAGRALDLFSAIGSGRTADHLEWLGPLAEHEDAEVREALVSTLRRSTDPEVTEFLLELRADPAPEVRRAVAVALARRLAEQGVRAALEELAADPDSLVRTEARAALAAALATPR